MLIRNSILFFIAWGLMFGCTPKRPTLPRASVEYRSDVHPFSVSYDLNRWRILSPSESEVVMRQADVVLTDPDGEFYMAVIAEKSSASLKEMRTRALIALQQRSPNLKVLSQQPVTVASVPALMIDLQGTVREAELAYELVFVQYGGMAYQLAYWTDARLFHDRVNEFRDFVRSFRPRGRRVASAPANPVAYPSPEAGYIITLPSPEWMPSDEKISDEADRVFQTGTSLAYLMVVSEELPISLDSLVDRGVSRMAARSGGRFKALGVRDITVDGVPAKVVSAQTSVEGGLYRYSILFAVHKGVAYQIAAWAPADLYAERYREQFLDIFRTLQFTS